MPVWRLQCAFGADNNLPRDRVVFTPHFDDHGIATDPQGLCDDLSTALAAWAGGGREVHVKAYDAQGTPPVFPQGDSLRNANVCPPSSVPRDVAICLSFYSERNLPRRRGRLYVCPAVCGISVTAVRPSSTVTQDKVAALVPIFADLGGIDVDWSVYSRADDVARPVTDWFIDDEWDTVRSRGLRATTRTIGTIP